MRRITIAVLLAAAAITPVLALAQWVYLGLPGYQERKGQNVDQNAINMVKIPPQFYVNLRSVVGEGTTLLATDGAMVTGSTGRGLTVLTSD